MKSIRKTHDSEVTFRPHPWPTSEFDVVFEFRCAACGLSVDVKRVVRTRRKSDTPGEPVECNFVEVFSCRACVGKAYLAGIDKGREYQKDDDRKKKSKVRRGS